MQELDLVASALNLGLFKEARALCEFLKFKNHENFAFVYGIAALCEGDLELLGRIIRGKGFWSEADKLFFSKSDGPLYVLLKLLREHSKSNLNMSQYLTKGDVCIPEILRDLFTSLQISLHEEPSILKLLNTYYSCVCEIRKLQFNNSSELGIDRNFLESPRLDLELGMAFLSMGQYKRAQKYFASAFFSNPFSCTGFDYYSTLLWHLNDKNGLFQLALESKDKYRDCRESRIVQGNYYSFSGNNEKAIECFKNAVDGPDGIKYALFLEGHDWLSLNNIQNAESAFKKLLDCEEECYMPYFGLGIVKFKQGHLEVARKYLKVAVTKNPNNSNICFYYSMVVESSGKRLEALNILNRFDQYLSSIIPYRIAKLQEAEGLLSDAINTIKMAVEYFPREPALYFLYAQIERKRGNSQKSIMLLKEANELDPSNSIARESLNAFEA